MCRHIYRNIIDQLSSTSISWTLRYLEVFPESRQVRDTLSLSNHNFDFYLLNRTYKICFKQITNQKLLALKRALKLSKIAWLLFSSRKPPTGKKCSLGKNLFVNWKFRLIFFLIIIMKGYSYLYWLNNTL